MADHVARVPILRILRDVVLAGTVTQRVKQSHVNSGLYPRENFFYIIHRLNNYNKSMIL